MTIGQDITPGIVSDIESVGTVSVGTESASNAAIVGQANLGIGEAEPNTPYTLTRAAEARQLFGDESLLTEAVMDAFQEGAMPVYVVATAESNETDDLGDIGTTSGTLQETPVREDAEQLDFDGREALVVYDDPDNYEVETGEVYVNPVTGDFRLDEVPETGEEVNYVAFDYDGALQGLQDEEADVIDYIAVLNENESVIDSLESTIMEMENYHQFAIGLCGVAPVLETEEYERPVDNSRLQLFYPSRNDTDDSILGGIAGLKARLGVDGSTMNRRLNSQSRLKRRIDFGDEANLIEEKTVPVQSETAGARIVDDPTAVGEDNTDEASMNQGYTRFVVNTVTEVIRSVEQRYIGSLHTPSKRASLEAAIDAQLSFLQDQNAILDYDVNVQERDSNSAYVDVSIETVEPLRNIYNTIAAGAPQ